jgi:AraC family transcriptional regulator
MKPTTLQDYKARLLRVLVHIQTHLDAPIALDTLARVACFSPFHFHHVFRGMIGESVKDHVRRLRLERAAVQLKLGSSPVTQIAFDAGYESHEAFTRAFKSAYGIAPSHFRAQHQPRLFITARSQVHWNPTTKLRRFKSTPISSRGMKVEIKSLPSLRVAFMRHFGPYTEVHTVWDELLMQLGKEGLLGGESLFLGIPHDDPEITPAEKLRYDACATVDSTFAPRGLIGVQEIAGGEYAVTTHLGPYDQMGRTYAKIFGQWLPRSGRELRDAPCFESYLNSPENTEPENLVTDIYVPLQTPRISGYAIR